MKHLIIVLVLSFTASFSMACDKANGAFNQKTGALTRSSIKPTNVTYSDVSSFRIGQQSKQQK